MIVNILSQQGLHPINLENYIAINYLKELF